jgi:ABC-type bacteriocin/lantibiotic exporter with double-glycine peptidase domain
MARLVGKKISKSMTHKIIIIKVIWWYTLIWFRVILKNINLNITEELIAIVGEVGSGKTSLAAAMIGEITRLIWI